jgi:hypothetical protein
LREKLKVFINITYTGCNTYSEIYKTLPSNEIFRKRQSGGYEKDIQMTRSFLIMKMFYIPSPK